MHTLERLNICLCLFYFTLHGVCLIACQPALRQANNVKKEWMRDDTMDYEPLLLVLQGAGITLFGLAPSHLHHARAYPGGKHTHVKISAADSVAPCENT